MQFTDPIYGEHIFQDKVLIELINSQPIQRLKGICQFGIPDEWHHKKNFSRFEHSIGTCILLAKLGAPLEEQIAGLLHDVGHTAFSHVTDFLFGDRIKEDLNDQLYFNIISTGEIADILHKNGFVPERFKDIKKFPLLKKAVPNVCADSLDYALREMAVDGKKDLVTALFNDLSVYENKIIFNSLKNASNYALEFLKMNNENWAHPKTVTEYVILSDILKTAIENNVIQKEDIMKTDNYVLERLHSSNLPSIQEGIRKLETGQFELIPSPTKIRIADPDILQDGKILRLSKIDPHFAKKRS